MMPLSDFILNILLLFLTPASLPLVGMALYWEYKKPEKPSIFGSVLSGHRSNKKRNFPLKLKIRYWIIKDYPWWMLTIIFLFWLYPAIVIAGRNSMLGILPPINPTMLELFIARFGTLIIIIFNNSLVLFVLMGGLLRQCVTGFFRIHNLTEWEAAVLVINEGNVLYHRLWG
jgi:hypothetical protein